MVSTISNIEAYTENLISKENPAISSLISFVDDDHLNPVKKHLLIERGMLEKKLISLKEQSPDILTEINQLQERVKQYDEVLKLLPVLKSLPDC
jgi:hypothetical protein